MSAAELVRKIAVPPIASRTLNGTRAIAGDPSLRLAHFFGTAAQFWMNLQSFYEVRFAQKEAGKFIISLPTLKRTDLVRA